MTGDILVWPENAEAAAVFSKLGTQWRISPTGGVSGLIYAEFWKMLRALKVPRARWLEILDSVQVMESAVLDMGGPGHG